MHRLALVTTLLITSNALAQNPTPDGAPPAPVPPTMPTTPTMPDPSATTTTPPPEEEEKGKEKKHESGDFDAGGQLRFPKGPDEMGEYKAFNWVAFDAKGTYYLLPTVTLNGFFPFAVKKPETFGGAETKLLGGALFRLDASIPKLPKMPFLEQETSMGLQVGFAYMREGALLLSDKDFPLFLGDLQPGFLGGLLTRVKLSTVVDFNFNPVFLFQKGTAENLTAIQIPLSLVLKLGDVLKLGAETGINTGDDFSFGPKNGGRISLGVAIDLEISKLAVHLGTGFASLLTSDEGQALYPSIGDSIYFDFNVKYVK